MAEDNDQAQRVDAVQAASSKDEARDGPWWMRPWSGLTHCLHCNALQRGEVCPVCGGRLDLSPMTEVINGIEDVVHMAVPGAFPWSISVILGQMQVEWERPLAATRRTHLPAQRFAIVILFWTLFEILMDRFYAAAFADLPGDLADELLSRFPSVGGRLDRLYKRRWRVTFRDDLVALGYADVAKVLEAVQTRRNAFMHGDPEAIDDALVDLVVDNLTRVQEGWVAVFNIRCTGYQTKVPLWEADARKLRSSAGSR